MNHLAHCLLSFQDDDLLVGNFIGDFVKGHDWQAYPERVQKGILLHRTIDSYTDHHERIRAGMARLRPYAGRYAGPVYDILCDHLLSLHWPEFSTEAFDVFAERTYSILMERVGEMPVILLDRVPRMVAGRFLHGYQTREGLEWVLDRFSRRLPPDFDAKALCDAFFADLAAFSQDFRVFFPELRAEAQRFAAVAM